MPRATGSCHVIADTNRCECENCASPRPSLRFQFQIGVSLHFPAKAKQVIFLFLNGGLSQIDSCDRRLLNPLRGQ